jgi:hypothetical protein
VLPWGQDHVVIIGSVPCKVPADVQANASGFGRDDTRPEAADEVSRRGPKRAHLISATGREIVGPRFSRGPTTLGHSCAKQKPRADDKGGQAGLGNDAGREKASHVAEERNKQVGRESTSQVNSQGDVVGVQKMLALRWCPHGLTKTQQRRVQKLRALEIKLREIKADRYTWFNQEWPMTVSRKTW